MVSKCSSLRERQGSLTPSTHNNPQRTNCLKIQEIDKKSTERLEVFDGKMADALEKTFQQLFELHISLESSIFRVAHIAKTPRTDFMQLLNHAQRGAGKVSSGILDEVLLSIRDYVEGVERLNSAERTELVKFIKLLPLEKAAHAERIHEILAGKPD